jgi:hypothetical protein
MRALCLISFLFRWVREDASWRFCVECSDRWVFVPLSWRSGNIPLAGTRVSGFTILQFDVHHCHHLRIDLFWLNRFGLRFSCILFRCCSSCFWLYSYLVFSPVSVIQAVLLHSVTCLTKCFCAVSLLFICAIFSFSSRKLFRIMSKFYIIHSVHCAGNNLCTSTYAHSRVYVIHKHIHSIF